MFALSTLVAVFLSVTAIAMAQLSTPTRSKCSTRMEPYNSTHPEALTRRCNKMDPYNSTNPEEEKPVEVFNHTRTATPRETIMEPDNSTHLEAPSPSTPAMSPTQDSGYVCHPNFAPGVRLRPFEIPIMIHCYEVMLSKRWINDPEHCARTGKWFQSWGQNWDNPDDCYSGCKWCFASAVAEGAANFHCFKDAGWNAKCHVMYG